MYDLFMTRGYLRFDDGRFNLPLTLERDSKFALKDSNPFSVASRTCNEGLVTHFSIRVRDSLCLWHSPPASGSLVLSFFLPLFQFSTSTTCTSPPPMPCPGLVCLLEGASGFGSGFANPRDRIGPSNRGIWSATPHDHDQGDCV